MAKFEKARQDKLAAAQRNRLAGEEIQTGWDPLQAQRERSAAELLEQITQMKAVHGKEMVLPANFSDMAPEEQQAVI
jgi:hypothetical protein